MRKLLFVILTGLFMAMNIFAVETVSRITWKRLRDKARARYLQDIRTYSKEDMRDANELYSTLKRRWRNAEGKKSLKLLQELYPKANRTGCALVEAGKRTTGQQKFDLFQLAIDNYSDCFYPDGVQIGPYAKLLLASAYAKKGDWEQSNQLLDDIVKHHSEAINHSGEYLAALIAERRFNETILTESFQISSGKENHFSLENRLIKVSGVLEETPFENKKEPDFFTAYVNTEVIRLEKKMGVMLSVACYAKNNRLIFADSTMYSVLENKKGQYLSQIFGLVPRDEWAKADHYVITVLIGKPVEGFGMMLKPDMEL